MNNLLSKTKKAVAQAIKDYKETHAQPVITEQQAKGLAIANSPVDLPRCYDFDRFSHSMRGDK